jgi:hypothetical protein
LPPAFDHLRCQEQRVPALSDYIRLILACEVTRADSIGCQVEAVARKTGASPASTKKPPLFKAVVLCKPIHPDAGSNPNRHPSLSTIIAA